MDIITVLIILFSIFILILFFIIIKLMPKKDKGYQRYKIILKDRFFPVRFTGKYRRDLETNNWHYYETHRGIIWHFRKENLVGVKGDTSETVKTNKG